MCNFVISPQTYNGKKYISKVGNEIKFFDLYDYKEFSKNDCLLLDENIFSILEKLYCINFPKDPFENFRTAYKSLNKDNKETENIPLELCVPEQKYSKLLIEYTEKISDILSSINLEYYIKYFLEYEKTFKMLKPAKINQEKLNSYKKMAADSQKEILESFMPYDGIYCKKPIYSILDTKTGRQTIIDGPQILTIKKDYRDIIESSFGENGSIWIFDYSAFEPRTLLGITKPKEFCKNLPRDIYEKILEDINLKNILPRNIAKNVITSMIYGQNKHTSEEILSKHIRNANDFMETIWDYFEISGLKEKLVAEAKENNGQFITNIFGRRIRCEETKPYALINYETQSSAVDISLNGFGRIIRKIEKIQEYIKPIFILHDALILDIHKDAEYIIPKIEEIGSVDLPNVEHVKFYLKSERLN